VHLATFPLLYQEEEGWQGLLSHGQQTEGRTSREKIQLTQTNRFSRRKGWFRVKRSPPGPGPGEKKKKGEKNPTYLPRKREEERKKGEAK